MPGRATQFAAGCYYHLYNRGANRSTIFPRDEDFRDFVRRLLRNAPLHGITIIAWCLMPNHFHLLVRQRGDECAGRLVQCTCNGYAQAFNRRYGHSGTLFQGRYQAILARRTPDFQTRLGYAVAGPGQANMTMSTNQLARL